MTRSLMKVGGGIKVGLLWAAGWMPVGPLTGLIVDPDASMDEPWVVVGAISGFFCGAVFCTLHRLAGGGRRMHQLSFPRAAALGALSGLIVPVLFVLLVAMGLGTWRGGHTPWLLVAGMAGATILGSTCAAFVSLAVARWGRRQALETPAARN